MSIGEALPQRSYTVCGAGGVGLHAREWGDPAGIPILLVHGWSQCHLCWLRQQDEALARDFRLVALDLRGHGMSDAPPAGEDYADGGKWADDLASVIAQLRLERPVLVGWSYGGLVIGDYLRKYGEDSVAGIDLVASAVALHREAFGSLIGPGFLENAPPACDPDLAISIPAIRRFLRACLARPVPQELFETLLAFNMVVPARVRAALIQRQLDFGPELEQCRLPVLVTHGMADTVVLPAMAAYALERCRTAEASWYEGVGHAPFLEAPERFNRELAAFARRVYRGHASSAASV